MREVCWMDEKLYLSVLPAPHSLPFVIKDVSLNGWPYKMSPINFQIRLKKNEVSVDYHVSVRQVRFFFSISALHIFPDILTLTSKTYREALAKKITAS